MMVPLELATLPENADMMFSYIDGRCYEPENALFISERLLFVPIVEFAKYWDYKTDEKNETTIISIKNCKYEVTDSFIYRIGEGRKKRLEYLVRKVDMVTYVDAMFLAQECGVTITWESGSYSAYFATVLHYDGYRKAPEEIFTLKKAIEKYKGLFMYVDGLYYKWRDGKCKVCTDDGIIYLSDRDRLTNGNEYRFGFRYEGIANIQGNPMGSMWEICEINDSRRIGNMIYAKDSWDRIEKLKTEQILKSPQKEDKEIDKDALALIFRQHPFITQNRKKMYNVLNDLIPQNKREINLMMAAFDNAIFEEISNAEVLDDIFVHNMSSRMVKNNGLQLQYALDAVCLCCEVYGTRIKGKEFTAKQKYNEKTQKMLEEREKDWILTSFTCRKRLGDLSYPVPSAWNSDEASFPHQGYYYYPYNDDRAMIWISKKELPGNETAENFNFIAMSRGLTKDPSDFISMIDYSVGRVKGKKINYYLPIDDKKFELDSYFFTYGNEMYAVHFGEETALTMKMVCFEKEYLKHFIFAELRKNDHSESIDLLDISIDILGLPTRAYCCLKRAGIGTVEALCNMTMPELLKIRNIGRKSCDEIVECLKKAGLSLREEIDDEMPFGDGPIDLKKQNKNRLGIQAYNNGDYELAASLFKDSLEFDDEPANITYNLACAYYALVIRNNRDYVDEALHYAKMALEKGHSEAAYKVARLYAPNSSCKIKERIESVNEAITYYIMHIEMTEYGKDTDLTDTFNNLGIIMYENKDDYMLATICAAISLRFDPENETVQRNKKIYHEKLSQSEIDIANMITIEQAVELLKKTIASENE